jgi:hypothetical protein
MGQTDTDCCSHPKITGETPVAAATQLGQFYRYVAACIQMTVTHASDFHLLLETRNRTTLPCATLYGYYNQTM